MARTTTPRKPAKSKSKTEAVKAAVEKTELKKVAARSGDTLERYEEVAVAQAMFARGGTPALTLNRPLLPLGTLGGIGIGLAPIPATASKMLVATFKPFAKLATNVKGGGEFALGPCTAFVGDNRTGKTSKLLAAQLAIRGMLPGKSGPADLFGLAPPDADGLTARLEGPSGYAHLVIPTEQGKAKQPLHAVGGLLEGLTPEQLSRVGSGATALDLLTKGANAVRAMVFQRFCTLRAIPEPAHLSPEQKKWWTAALEAVAADAELPTLADQLAAMPAALRSLKLAAGKERTKHNAVYEEKRRELASQKPPTDSDVVQAAGGNAKVENALRARAAFEAERTKLNEWGAKLPEDMPPEPPRPATVGLDAPELKGLVATVQAAEDALKATEGQGVLDQQLLATLPYIDKKCAEGGTCFCGGNYGPSERRNVQILVDHIKARATNRPNNDPLAEKARDAKAALETTLAALRKSRTGAWISAQSEWTRIKHDMLAFSSSYDALAAEKSRLLSVFAELRLDFNNPPVPSGDISEIRAEAVGALVGLKAEFAAMEEARQAMQQDEFDFELCKTLEKEADKLLNDQLQLVKQEAEIAVGHFMPQGEEVELVLEKNACHFAVIGADGRPHGDAIESSGVEFASLALALAQAWMVDDPLRILFVDDDVIGKFDEKGVTALFDALAAAVTAGTLTQVFAAWNRAHEIKFVEGWTIVKCTKEA